jgi:hypothetical protein
MRDVPMATLLLERAANPDHPSAAALTACVVPRFADIPKSCACRWRTVRTHWHMTGRGTLRWLGRLAQKSSIDSRLGDPLRRRKAA